MKKKKLLVAMIISVLVVLGVVAGAILLSQGNKASISFKKAMPKTITLDEMIDITPYIENPENLALTLTAEYQANEMESQYTVLGLSFTPTEMGKVKITVTENETGQSIEKTLKVVEGAPQIMTTTTAEYYQWETIELSELLDYVVYKSETVPELIVDKVEYGKEKEFPKNQKEFKFNEETNYIFYITLKNTGGTASSTVLVDVTRELTENEKNDLTNKLQVDTNYSHATLKRNDDEHSKNSDWSWEIQANPADVFGSSGFYHGFVHIDFEDGFDPNSQYFTIDVKGVNIDRFRFKMRDENGKTIESPVYDFEIQDGWFTVSSEKIYDIGKVGGIQIVVLHPRGEDKLGTYDVNNVKALVDNLHIHKRDKVKGPANTVVPANGRDGVAEIETLIPNNIEKSAYLQMDGKYTNECFEFKTKFTGSSIYIGARLDQVAKNLTKSKGIIIEVHEGYLAYYAPNYASKNHVASVFYGAKLERGKDYTFQVMVAEGSTPGTNNLWIIIKDGDKVVTIYEHESNERAKKDITDGVSKSGSFAVWSLDESREIAYKMPYTYTAKLPKQINTVVGADGSDGTTVLQTIAPGNIDRTAYLKMDGNYTNECFEFTTKYTGSSIRIGARLDNATGKFVNSKGIIIEVNKGYLAYYAPSYSTEGYVASVFYGTNLVEGKEYTFQVMVSEGSKAGTNNLWIFIKDGDKVITTYEHESNEKVKRDITAGVPSKGSFAVWSVDESREIAYKMPYTYTNTLPKQVNTVVQADGSDGTTVIQTIAPGNIERTAYLKMEGNYTNECFEFTTKYTGSSIRIGARLDNVTGKFVNSKGIIIEVNAGYLAYYAPSYTSENHVASVFYGSNLTIGKDYTFQVMVAEGSTPGTNNLWIIIKDGDKVVTTYEHASNEKAKKDITEGVSSSGSFAVWSVDESREIAYKMPYTYTDTLPKQVNTVVQADGSDGTTVIQTIAPGNIERTAYLKMEGNYTNECFEFTTKYTGSSIRIGARLDNVTSKFVNSQGIIIEVNPTYFAYYAPSYSTPGYVASVNYGSTLVEGKEYTFQVMVLEGSTPGTNNLWVIIKDGDNIVTTYEHESNAKVKKDITVDVPASGSFAVWSEDGSREITYKMPYTYTGVLPKQQNVVVEENGNAGTTTIQTLAPGNYGRTAYLHMKGNYTNECFEFKTTYTNRMFIGARLDKVGGNFGNSTGIIIDVQDANLNYYAPGYSTEGHVGKAVYNEPLQTGKEYTFMIAVVEGSTPGTNNLKIIIKDGDKNVLSYEHEANASVKKTDITTGVPESGSFAVWSIDEVKEITYYMPSNFPVDMTGATFNFSGLIKDHNADTGIIQFAIPIDGGITNAPANMSDLYGKGRLNPVDDESGWFIDGQRIDETVNTNNHVWAGSKGELWYFTLGNGIDEATLAGKTITVKGRFESTGDNAGYTVIMPELQFKYENSNWVYMAPPVTVDMTGAKFNFSKLTVDKASQFAIDATESISNKPNNIGVIYGTGVLYPADDNSGWYLDGERVDPTVSKINYNYNTWYFTIGKNATEGQIATVKGNFTKTVDGVPYIVIMPELEFKYENGTWVHMVPPVTVDMTGAEFNFSKLTVDKASQFAIDATESISNKPENIGVIYGTGVLYPADDNSGWYLDGERVDPTISKINYNYNTWYFTIGKNATEGQIATVKGNFTKTVDGVPYIVIMPELQFKYENGTWKPI